MRLNTQSLAAVLAGLLSTILLAGCDGTPPPPTEVRLNPAPIKALEFRWIDGLGATHHRLLENRDGQSGFSVVADNIRPGTQHYRLEVPLHQRLNAQYLIESCNSNGCSASATLSVNGGIRAAIGYLKASNADAGDGFGGGVSLNADGSVLAVAASGEDSASRGLGPLDRDIDASDNSAPESGAVYIFVREAGRWRQQAYLKAANADPGDQFGAIAGAFVSLSLNAAGDMLAVGAFAEAGAGRFPAPDPSDNSAPNAGAVYVFVRRASGEWHQQAYLKASDTAAGDSFGTAVSLNAAGDVLAVGAYEKGGGAVYLYRYLGGYWQAPLKLEASESGDQSFGQALSLDAAGNWLAVGATGVPSGVAYLFSGILQAGSANDLTSTRLSAGTGDFGSALSLSGNGRLLAVVDSNDHSAGQGVYPAPLTNSDAPGSGAVYLYEPEGDVWPQPVAFIKAGNSDPEDRFGYSVSLDHSGTWLAVGAWFENGGSVNAAGAVDPNNNNTYRAGAAYLFHRAAGLWQQHSYLKASNPDDQDNFGEYLSLSGDGATLAVGVGGEDSAGRGLGGDASDNGAVNTGAVFLY